MEQNASGMPSSENGVGGEEIVYKTKDYVRRAKSNYYNKKKATDEVFRKSEKERAAKWRDANREVINERARIRRREIKKKEAEKKEAEKKKEGSANAKMEQSINQLVAKTETLLAG